MPRHFSIDATLHLLIKMGLVGMYRTFVDTPREQSVARRVCTIFLNKAYSHRVTHSGRAQVVYNHGHVRENAQTK